VSGSAIPVDAGLLARFRAAAPAIAWRPVPRARPPARIAHLNDEESYVRTRSARGRTEVVVESGPVGALVLLLEIDARGAPHELWAEDTAAPPFPQGALGAAWGPARGAPPERRAIPVADLVALARYGLA